jgi:hypothetical protein
VSQKNLEDGLPAIQNNACAELFGHSGIFYPSMSKLIEIGFTRTKFKPLAALGLEGVQTVHQ